jgi:ELWxxDGT repeat protein
MGPFLPEPPGQGTVLPDRETEISAGGVTLTVPPGVVSQPATATVVPIPGGERSLGGVGASIHIDANWQDGSKAVKITMPLDPDLASPLGPDLEPAVVHESAPGSEREILSGGRLEIDGSARTVSFETTSLSSFFSISLPRPWLIVSAPTVTESSWIIDAFQDFVGAGADQPSCNPDITADPAVTSEGSAFSALPGLGTAIRHCVGFRAADAQHPDRGRWTLANNTGAVLRYNAGPGGTVVNVGPAKDLLTDALFLPLNGVVDTGTDETILGGEVVIPPGGSAALAVDAGEEGEVTFTPTPGLQVQAFLLRQAGAIIGSKADAVKLLELLDDCGYNFAVSDWEDLPQIIRDCGLTILDQGGVRLAKLALRIAFAADAAIAAADSLTYSFAPLTAGLGYDPGPSGPPTGIGGNLVADVNPGSPSSGPKSSFADLGSSALFFADDGQHGTELWRTDGTAANASLVRDIRPGSDSSDDGLVFRPDFVRLGERVLFPANDGASGVGLWASDGTTSGTTLVKDITPSLPDRTRVRDFTRLDADTILFTVTEYDASDAPVLGQLWRTDGSAAGTTVVADFGGQSFGQLAVSGDTAYFVVGWPRELWRTDGTAAGTVRVTSDEDELPDPVSINEIAPAGDGVVLSAYSSGGMALWRSDGTAGGTEVLRALDPGYLCCTYGFAPVGDAAFFIADDGTTGDELWRTDGTAGGTELVKDINPGTETGMRGVLSQSSAVLDGHLYFAAEDGLNGAEPWRSDGTDAGTIQVADIASGAASSVPQRFTVIGDHIVFFAQPPTRDEVWRTDGEITEQLFHGGHPDGPSLHYSGGFGSAGAKPLFYAEDGSHGWEPWTAGD